MKTVDDYGRVILDEYNIFEMLYQGRNDLSDILVKDTDSIEEYNKQCMINQKQDFCLHIVDEIPHTPEEEHQARSSDWLIPTEYRQIDVRTFVHEMCNTKEEHDRVDLEMDMFEEREMIPLLQTMIFLVGKLRENNIIWGVGRGSSVASYVLYKLGVHRINSLLYSLDIKEFLK